MPRVDISWLGMSIFVVEAKDESELKISAGADVAVSPQSVARGVTRI